MLQSARLIKLALVLTGEVSVVADIVISYKREEQQTARALADALRAEGWRVWWDELRAGEHFDDAIEQAELPCRSLPALAGNPVGHGLGKSTPSQIAELLYDLIADDALAGGHGLPDELRRAPVLGSRTVVEGRNGYVGIEEESSVHSARRE